MTRTITHTTIPNGLPPLEDHVEVRFPGRKAVYTVVYTYGDPFYVQTQYWRTTVTRDWAGRVKSSNTQCITRMLWSSWEEEDTCEASPLVRNIIAAADRIRSERHPVITLQRVAREFVLEDASCAA